MASLPASERQELLRTLTEEQAAELLCDWHFWARPDQLPPEGDWAYWAIIAGRGAGKTRTGAEWAREQIEQKGRMRGGFVGATAADARDYMVEGESGLLSCCPPGNMPVYEPSKRRLTWPNGAVVTIFSADEPERLRGPNFEFVWCDELAAWRYPAAWDNLVLGLRIGDNPQAVITTTPRPRKFLKDILTDPATVVTRASTYDNLLHLAPSFARKILRRFEGTRLGEQELLGKLLEDIEGALWTREMIEGSRVAEAPEMVRIVVAIDPAVSTGPDSSDTGIVAGGLGIDGHGYVLHDDTCHLSPHQWATRAVNRLHDLEGDRIVGEVNNGGDLVEAQVRTVDRSVPFKQVRASRGKRVRAEPVAGLYEQGRIHHVGNFEELEEQMCNFAPGNMDESPDRMDALVWALWELIVQYEEAGEIKGYIV